MGNEVGDDIVARLYEIDPSFTSVDTSIFTEFTELKSVISPRWELAEIVLDR